METELLLSILAIAGLLILSGLFSGSETGLTAASRARMHHLERTGNGRAGKVNDLIKKKDKLIGAILLGNNLVNILASALATSILIAAFGEAGVAYATVIMTALVLIFAEVLPKTYALYNADRVALAMSPLLAPVVKLLSPITAVVQAVVNLTLRLFGVQVQRTGELVSSADELRGTLDLQTREGGLIKTDRDMLDSILDLSDVTVFDIMVHRKNMIMIDAGQEPPAIVREMLDSPHTRIPLWRDDAENIVGVLHAKDLLRALSENDGSQEKLNVVELARDPWFVPETTSLMEQLNAFQARREHFALVIDEYGALMGLVTLEDILEEIVGEISDEHDIAAASQIRRQTDGSYVVDGSVTVRDLNRHCDWELPEDDAATVAGLLIHLARRIPEGGDRFSFHDFGFEVLRRQRNQITMLRIRPPARS